ncbi:MAG: hypothetical protein GXY50_04645 [Syntrophomonadaceae bacterium]|nr:hypothetical protein [Syntrophomonadaceae bacterium]
MKTCWKSMVAGGLALALILILLFSRQEVAPPQKPSPEKTPQWYLINKATRQISTAYTEVAGAPPSASAEPYFIGAVAVHPKVPGGSHLDPIIPFGTIIMLEKPESITIQGKTLNAFTVIDTGDANWSRYGDSPYWVDFYFGTGGYWANQAALEYGQRPIDYYWYEPFE